MEKRLNIPRILPQNHKKHNMLTTTIMNKVKRGRKPGTKNTTAPKTQPLAAAQPADLRRLAAVLEEIADLEAQTAKLDTLRTEAEELKNRLTAKQA